MTDLWLCAQWNWLQHHFPGFKTRLWDARCSVQVTQLQADKQELARRNNVLELENANLQVVPHTVWPRASAVCSPVCMVMQIQHPP